MNEKFYQNFTKLKMEIKQQIPKYGYTYLKLLSIV